VKNLFFLIIGVFIIIWSFYVVWHKPSPYLGEGAGEVSIEGKTFKVEIADNDIERAKGLSGREFLAQGHGILFIFPQPGVYGFWMKDMNFSIDIVWLDEDLKVVGIEQNVGPETFPQTFYPPVHIKYVVEVNAGEL